VIVVTQSSTYVSCEAHVHQLLQQLCMYFQVSTDDSGTDYTTELRQAG